MIKLDLTTKQSVELDKALEILVKTSVGEKCLLDVTELEIIWEKLKAEQDDMIQLQLMLKDVKEQC